jgi:hypothetical protein
VVGPLAAVLLDAPAELAEGHQQDAIGQVSGGAARFPSAPRVERVDEAEEVEEVEGPVLVAVRAGIAGVEEIDERQEVEEVERAVAVEVVTCLTFLYQFR